MIDPVDAENIIIPTCLLASEEEKESIGTWVKKLKVENYIERFDDQIHGWMSARADLEDENVRKEYERGYRIFLEWFAKHL